MFEHILIDIITLNTLIFCLFAHFIQLLKKRVATHGNIV